jgi:hypothetical protein
LSVALELQAATCSQPALPTQDISLWPWQQVYQCYKPPCKHSMLDHNLKTALPPELAVAARVQSAPNPAANTLLHIVLLPLASNANTSATCCSR